MIVNPNDSGMSDIRTGLPLDPDGKKPRGLKILIAILIVHFLFTLFDAFVFQGPAAYKLLYYTGPGTRYVTDPEYRIRPKQNEIVMNWTESVYDPWSETMGKETSFTREIPLAPLPPELARCRLEVTIDPAAPRVRRPRIRPSRRGPSGVAIASVKAPSFDAGNLIGTEPENLSLSLLGAGNPVIRLKVHPSDERVLSHEFILSINPRGGEHTLIFPYSVGADGRREVIVSTSGPNPFESELEDRTMEFAHKAPSPGRMFKRIVMMPLAAIPDFFSLLKLILMILVG